MDRAGVMVITDLGNQLVAEVARLADANEAIVKLAGEQQELVNAPQPGPPFCPHCGHFDPEVQQLAAGGGRMSEFILVAQCSNCSNTLYGVVEGWQVFTTADDAAALTDMKGGDDDGTS